VHLFSLIRQLSQLLYGCCAKIASYTLCLAFTPLLINSTSKIIKSTLTEIEFEINRNIQQVLLRSTIHLQLLNVDTLSVCVG
jgi:hypothetical protein